MIGTMRRASEGSAWVSKAAWNPSAFAGYRLYPMPMAVATLQTTASVVIALFLLQLLKRLTAGRSNGIASGVNGGLTFLLGN